MYPCNPVFLDDVFKIILGSIESVRPSCYTGDPVSNKPSSRVDFLEDRISKERCEAQPAAAVTNLSEVLVAQLNSPLNTVV